MKAAFIERHGPAESILYGDLPRPELHERSVLVRLGAVAVDHVDTFIRSGAFRSPVPFPFVLGRDMTGVVETVGGDVRRFRPGDRVWSNCLGIDGLQGTFAEYLAVPEDRLYHLPDEVDPVEAVAVLHSALAAVIGLFDKARLSAGDTLFVNGGSGCVGTAVVQIAKSCGARVAATAGGDEKRAWCRQAGADPVISYRSDDVDKALRDFAPAGVDVYWDATPQFDMEHALRQLAQRGRIVAMAGLNHSCRLPLGPFYTRNATLFGFTVTGTTTEEYARYARQINGWLRNETLKAKIHAVLPLSEAARAHRLQEDGGLFGKLVLVPDGSA
ncbi:MAG TPA: NADPH:quinone reductase [Pirellulales bacterium]|nr:NADPH:quinone reductase [Pirellulales bacterium]